MFVSWLRSGLESTSNRFCTMDGTLLNARTHIYFIDCCQSHSHFLLCLYIIDQLFGISNIKGMAKWFWEIANAVVVVLGPETSEGLQETCEGIDQYWKVR